MRLLFTVVALTAISLGVFSCARHNEEELAKIVEEAYIYAYPLVLMDATKQVMTATSALTATQAPVNQMLNKRTFPNATFTDVVSPNADTLYSMAWLDVSKEPIILTVPDTHGRYYVMEMLDEWTNVFAAPGTRTTGDGKAAFAVTGPNWQKTPLPEGVQELRSPTNIAWLIGRVKTDGSSDYDAVHVLQDQFKLIPLSSWGKSYAPPEDVAVAPHVDVRQPPVTQVENLTPKEFFSKFAALLKNAPPAPQDKPMVEKLARIGLVPGLFDVSQLSPAVVDQLEKLMTGAQDKIKHAWQTQPDAIKENHWNMLGKPVGNYGTNYLLRAAVAYAGLGANLPEDAMYPNTNIDSEGQRLSGANNYVIHFDKGKLPPVKGFWSLTMYNDSQFFVNNSINRYAIGDRNALKANPDGSVDIYIQHASPGAEKESNWLPAAAQEFNLILRLYYPDKEILDGQWKVPPVQRVAK